MKTLVTKNQTASTKPPKEQKEYSASLSRNSNDKEKQEQHNPLISANLYKSNHCSDQDIR